MATQCYTCYHWLPRILKRFGETVPDVDLQIVPEATNETVEALLGERIDLAILHSHPQHTEIAAVHLFDDEMVAILPPDHRLAGQEWVEPADFAEEHLLLHTPPEESLLLSRYLIPAGVRPQRISQLSLTEAIFETIRAGLGVTAVAAWMARAEVEAGHLCTARLAPDGLKRKWYAATLRKSEGLESVGELIRLLQKESAVTVDRCRLACATRLRPRQTLTSASSFSGSTNATADRTHDAGDQERQKTCSRSSAIVFRSATLLQYNRSGRSGVNKTGTSRRSRIASS